MIAPAFHFAVHLVRKIYSHAIACHLSFHLFMSGPMPHFGLRQGDTLRLAGTHSRIAMAEAAPWLTTIA